MGSVRGVEESDPMNVLQDRPKSQFSQNLMMASVVDIPKSHISPIEETVKPKRLVSAHPKTQKLLL